MKFALIPPGTFMMGSPKDEAGRSNDETRHKVKLTRGFLIGIHPVTQACWRSIMRNNPSSFKGNELPVERVSWGDCQEFLRKLSEREGHSYRLPTQAEWEFACRAGTTTPFCYGKTITAELGNFEGGPGKTTPVGSYRPNAWGLFDMYGNVWEWCADWHAKYGKGNAVDPTGPESGSSRVLRGGSWLNQANVRSAERHYFAPSERNYICGFRLARTI
jgi:formylglycine-generating enzyme